MIGITVFSYRLIISYALKHFWKHSPHGIFFETVSVTRDDALDKQYWISQSGESHDSVTHSVNKYVTCTHNAQIRQVSILKDASRRKTMGHNSIELATSQSEVGHMNLCLRYCGPLYVIILFSHFSHLLIPRSAIQNAGPDMDPLWWYSWNIFWKRFFYLQMSKMHSKLSTKIQHTWEILACTNHLKMSPGLWLLLK